MPLNNDDLYRASELENDELQNGIIQFLKQRVVVLRAQNEQLQAELESLKDDDAKEPDVVPGEVDHTEDSESDSTS